MGVYGLVIKHSRYTDEKGPDNIFGPKYIFCFDNEFYKQVNLNKGILKIDQELALDKLSAPIVSNFAGNGVAFKQSFGNAMVKMGEH